MSEHKDKTGDKDTWTLVMSNSQRADDQDKGAIASQSKEPSLDEELDADGIMVITDEESDTVENNQTNITIESEQPQESPKTQENQQQSTPEPQPSLKKNLSVGDYDFDCYGMKSEELNDEYFTSGTKVRSYIHKRNNKVSGMLNTILVGAIIVTSCLAIGHVWGTTDDCSPEMAQSLKQLLYSMEELRQENFMLKLKLNTMQYASIVNDENSDESRKLTFKAFDVMESDVAPCVCSPNSDKSASGEGNTLIEPEAMPTLDDNIEEIKNDIDNDTLLRKKRSIDSTIHNSFIGPKTYKDQLEGSHKKYFKNNGKYPYTSKGNLSNANNKKSAKDSKYSFDENFKIRNEKEAKHKKNRKFENWQERKNKFSGGEAHKGKKYAGVEKKHDKYYKKYDKHHKPEFVS